MKPAIVVTGAASGLGRELARVAAREGSVMVLLDQSRQALDDFATELAASGAETHALCIDLAERDAGQRIEDALSERGVYCDVLVNSAGFGIFGAAAETDREEQLRLLDVTMRALTDLTLRMVPGMISRRRGGVLNVGSITGYMPGPNMAAYHASKAYVNSFSAGLAAELAGTGVTVTCLSPGIIRTAFFERSPISQTRLYKVMPHENAPRIAQRGWRAFRAGKSRLIPGLTNRVIVSGSTLLPQAVIVRLMSVLQQLR